VHFSFKIWHLMATDLVIFMRIDLTHLGEMPGVGGRFARAGGFSPT